MLVLGSSHRGAVGRIVPGGVASHLLACAPCALPVAPVRYAELARASVSWIGVRMTAPASLTWRWRQLRGPQPGSASPVHLYHAMHEISKDPARDKFRGHIEDFAQGILDAGLKQLPPELEATSSVLEGDVAEVIADAASGDEVDLLYVGSRGYGPLREALFGRVAGALLRTARCPLVIFPASSRPAVRGPSD
jgi:nucleotide-binding universal stress UspA family protein